jgi:hypothetical protein
MTKMLNNVDLEKISQTTENEIRKRKGSHSHCNFGNSRTLIYNSEILVITKSKSKKIKWQMPVYYLDSCNCDWACPCQFNAKPTYGNCEGPGGIHIIEGHYENIKVDGLNMVWIGSWPGPIHEGHRRGSFYIDGRVNEEQFHALSRILMGRAGGSPFVVYGMSWILWRSQSMLESPFSPRR